MKTLEQFYQESGETTTYEEFKKMNRVYTIPKCTTQQEQEQTIEEAVQKIATQLQKDKKYFSLQITKKIKKEQNPLLLEYKKLIIMKLVQQGYQIGNLQYHTTPTGEIYQASY